MKQRGSVLVEMAVVLPVLLLLIIGGIDLSLLTRTKANLDFIAGETARCMARTLGCNAQTFAQQEASGLGMIGTLTATATPLSGGQQQVKATYAWLPISPFIKPVTLTSTGVGVP